MLFGAFPSLLDLVANVFARGFELSGNSLS